jgi:hypothetical protein
MLFRSAALLTVFLTFSAEAVFAQAVPRTVSGKPDLQGIWQVQNRASYNLLSHTARQDMQPGMGVVVGDEIPYQPWAAEQQLANFENRQTDDPLSKCFLPGVPRIMYMEHPFHIFQTDERVAITFEWTQVFRHIYTGGQQQMYPGIEMWMGDSRGRWEGDVLVVEVIDHNDQTWFDAAGNFHSNAMHLTERYRMLDENTIEYEVTIEDENVFTRPWVIRMALHRQTHMDRILEYQCQSEVEEANGDFERDVRTWYPATIPEDNEPFDADAGVELPELTVAADIPRLADGTPDISGYYLADGGGSNYGLETFSDRFLLPDSRGVVVDPPDGILPYQTWAREERIDRQRPHRGYDDPTAHCFLGGVPRSHYIPAPFFFLQPPGHVVVLHERMSYRQIFLDGRAHLPDHIRLWQGDSVGRWEGDTLVVESTNFNGKAWLNEVGDVVSHAQTVIETFTPVSADQIIYRATVSDPIAYTRPWTMEMPFNREDQEVLETACLEDNNDLGHLKDVRDEYRAAQNQE